MQHESCNWRHTFTFSLPVTQWRDPNTNTTSNWRDSMIFYQWRQCDCGVVRVCKNKIVQCSFVFSTMQQTYGTSNSSSTPYMNTAASSLYNTSTYPYSSLSAARTLNQSCKGSSAYLPSPYSSPSSPFQAAGHSPQSGQYAPYSGYNAPGTSFAQGFSTQVNLVLEFCFDEERETVLHMLMYMVFFRA